MLLVALLGAAGAAPARRVPPGGIARWIGHWVADTQTIDIARLPGRELAIEGYATWGGDDPVRVANGAVHEADFSAGATPDGDHLRFGISGVDKATVTYGSRLANCRLDLRLKGRLLLVRNPDQCGGEYVSFSGTYRRAGAPRPPA